MESRGRSRSVRWCALVAALAAPACSTTLIDLNHVPAEIPRTPIVTAVDTEKDAAAIASQSAFTVFFFYSRHCHCVNSHDGRLKALYDDFHPRGVQFVAVDSEAGASLTLEEAEARKHGYPFPIFIDKNAALANAFDASYAAYALVADTSGHVHFAGGIDSDEMTLHDDARLYLRNALDALLTGHEPAITRAKALGCALQKW